MNGHPDKPAAWDKYAEHAANRRQTPTLSKPERVEPDLFITLCLVVALPAGALAFTLGYLVGAL